MKFNKLENLFEQNIVCLKREKGKMYNLQDRQFESHYILKNMDGIFLFLWASGLKDSVYFTNINK